MADWRRDIGDAVARAAVRLDEPLAGHTTFGIGGPADAWVEVPDVDALVGLLRFCRRAGIRWRVLGQGSNVLISDQGLRGVVVRLTGEFGKTALEEGSRIQGFKGSRVRALDPWSPGPLEPFPVTCLAAGAGALLDDVVEASVKAGLRGAEFLAGIPGTVGGGLATNAGAFGRSLSDVVESVVAVDEQGRVSELAGGDLGREYRRPVIREGLVATEVVLRLGPGDAHPAGSPAESVSEIRERRRARQPQEPSAGSFYKNPKSEPAGRIIERCGLKGRRVGGAQVSERHANFIVNTGSARFSDVYELTQVVKAGVEEQAGVLLEEEVQVLPERQEVS